MKRQYYTNMRASNRLVIDFQHILSLPKVKECRSGLTTAFSVL